MYVIAVVLVAVLWFQNCASAPTRGTKVVLLIPSSSVPYAQMRGPFDFIGNWIQSSEWFPIEINVPDAISSVGNGVGSFATNIGNGFTTFTQNVGSGFQTFTQNVGNNAQNLVQNLSQRFPVLAVFVRPPSTTNPQRYFVLMSTRNTVTEKDIPIPLRHMDSDILESFP